MAATPQTEYGLVSDTFHVAITMIGAQAMREVLDLWKNVSAGGANATATLARFSVQALKLVGFHRKRAMAVADAYIRLSRALETGFTVQHIKGYPLNGSQTDEKGSVRLSQLRREFEDAVKAYAPSALDSTATVPDRDTLDKEDDSHPAEVSGGRYRPWRLEDFTEDDRAVLDFIKDLDKAVTDQESEAEREATDLINSILDAYDKKLKDGKDPTEAWTTAGLVIGRTGERIAMNGGRHTVANVAKVDDRAIGWVRVHNPVHGDTPCYFCAMLLSRQVFYKSSKAAQHKGTDQDPYDNAYHTNCHCSAEPVYSAEHYDTDDRFKMNRLMWKEYQNWRDGHSTQTWRQYMEQYRASHDGPHGNDTDPKNG